MARDNGIGLDDEASTGIDFDERRTGIENTIDSQVVHQRTVLDFIQSKHQAVIGVLCHRVRRAGRDIVRHGNGADVITVNGRLRYSSAEQ